MEPLKLSDEIVRFLVSSPCLFSGSYETADFSIEQAWQGMYERGEAAAFMTQQHPYSRSYFIVSARLSQPPKEAGRLQPLATFAPLGEHVCSCLSVLYGKRFDCHGFLQTIGLFCVPELGPVGPVRLSGIGPTNHQPRPDLGIPLSFVHASRMAPLFLLQHADAKFQQRFAAAARYYRRSLELLDRDPDLAFIDLVTCGEILASHFTFDDDVLYDEETRDLLARIEQELHDGPKAARYLKGRLRQVKRRYVATVVKLLNDTFYENTEAKSRHYAIEKEGIERRIKSTYDLRSLFIHTGQDVLDVVLPRLDDNEIQLAWVADKEAMKVVSAGLTFTGLERVMRFCLLRFVHMNGVSIDSRLD
jgi:hypothetical protein